MGRSLWTTRGSSGSVARTAIEVAFLLGLGLIVVVLHVNFRIPLRLHGRHGIEFMALLLIGRIGFDRPWSGSLVGLGAASASLLPYWSFKDPLMPLWFLLPGLVVDAGSQLLGVWRHRLPFLVLTGALAHATKPLLRAAAVGPLGLSYGFLRDGLVYGVFLHLVFGAVGGLLAYLYVLGSRKTVGENGR